jgi:hypothetical protein
MRTTAKLMPRAMSPRWFPRSIEQRSLVRLELSWNDEIQTCEENYRYMNIALHEYQKAIVKKRFWKNSLT